MKFKSVVKFVFVLLALYAGNAKADFACQLSVVPANWWEGNNPIYVGQSFGFGINVGYWPQQGPYPPSPSYQFSVTFYGPDIPGGEAYPGTYAIGYYYLGGYYNPGGIEGTYTRYAVLRWPNGGTYCTTNEVNVVLQ